MQSTKLTRDQIPPGTWIYTMDGDRDVRNKVFQISDVEPYKGHGGPYLNILGAPSPNANGGFNVNIDHCRLATFEEIPLEFRKSEINNTYLIY